MQSAGRLIAYILLTTQDGKKIEGFIFITPDYVAQKHGMDNRYKAVQDFDISTHQ